MFFYSIDHEALVLSVVNSSFIEMVRTPCEWTIPLGVPVVPDENMTMKGVLNGT